MSQPNENMLADAQALEDNANFLPADENNENEVVVNQRPSRSPTHSAGRRLSNSLSPHAATPPSRNHGTARPLSAVGNTRLEYELIAGHRKNSKLLYTTDEKYLYMKHNKTKLNIQYDCYEKACGAKVFVTIRDGVCHKKSTNYTHNHTDAAQLVKDMKIKNTVKSNVSNSTILAANIGASGNGSVRTTYQNCLGR